MLLDHHQAFHAGQICACIDHHPTAYPPEGEFVCIKPVGACALLVMRLMEAAGVALTRAERELVVLAMYLDTIALRSSKISIDERRWAHDEAVRLGMDEAWLEREGMDLADMTLPPETLAMMGRKRYDFAGVSVCSTYVQTDAMTPALLDAIFGHSARRNRARRRAAMGLFGARSAADAHRPIRSFPRRRGADDAL